MLDPGFGPGYIRICSYFPYPAEVWVNGHSWAKRQAERAGLPCTELANGFGSCRPDPRTRVFTQGAEVKLDLTYERCRVKQYLEGGSPFASRP